MFNLPWNFITLIAVHPFIIAYHLNSKCDANIQMPHMAVKDDYLGNDMLEEESGQFNTPRDQTLVARLPTNTLLKYTSYKDVSILHFRVPPDTRTAFFTFKAYEESKSAFQRKCKPRKVSLHLKAGSYPVISPENITFPKNYLSADQRFKTYSLQFESNDEKQRILVDGPLLGNWFAVAFISWTDPSNDRIEQQGLAASCDTLLLAEMSVSRFHPIIITNKRVQTDTLRVQKGRCEVFESPVTSSTTKYNSSSTTGISKFVDSKYDFVESNAKNGLIGSHEFIYKFYVPRNVEVANVLISISVSCQKCPNIGFHFQSNAIPNSVGESRKSDENNYVHSSYIIKPNQTGDISFEVYLQPEAWYYLHVAFVNETNSVPKSVLKQSENRKVIKSLQLPSNQSISSNSSSYIFSQNQFQQKPIKEPNKNVPKEKLQPNRTECKESTCNDVEYSILFNFKEADKNDFKKVDKNKYQLYAANISVDTDANDTKFCTKPTLKPWQPIRFRNMDFYPLLRQTYREFFMFDYDLMPDNNGTVPAILNLTGEITAGFVFDIGEIYDIGGTLTFAVSMKQEYKTDSIKIRSISSNSNQQSETERNGILAEKLISVPAESNIARNENVDKIGNKTLSRSNQTIIVCMHLGEPGIPTWPDKCRYGHRLLPASSIVNNTDSNTSTGLVHVPFPESGQWYITMGLYCHGAETVGRITIIESVKEFVKHNINILDAMKPPCACFSRESRYVECVNDSKCLASLNETETLKLKECLMDYKCTSSHIDMTRKFEMHHKFSTEQHFALENCNTSVVFTVSSSPCVAGRCGRFGRCYHYMSGGFVFSTCVCMKGYRGWDCTEDSQVPSSTSILVASLLLTLSNLLFLPSIYMAARREYYTEAIIYLFAMFFSIFYHACDSGEDEYSFCLVKIGVLQFCDFYCGLLAIWVTLVAMSHIRQQFVSLLHMFGAILLAFGTELNKQSLWIFLAPALTGICIISTSWGLRCYKSRKWFPARKYLTIYMPFGTILVMVGLICYAFLQTKQNYHIVHSIWHMVMALSIICLLPSEKFFMPKC